jgi:formylglycine-generating enzyme required for sulfatase activity
MVGNVSEWCVEGFDAEVYKRYKAGDLSPPPPGEKGVFRGGGWSRDLPYCRATFRESMPLSYCRFDGGLRVAKSAIP